MTKSDAEVEREINATRYRWHEMAIADKRLRKAGASTVAVCGFMMHRFVVKRRYAECSLRLIEAELNMAHGTAIHAIHSLLDLGWLSVFERYTPGRRAYSASRYSLSFGNIETESKTGVGDQED